jgi:hypothetical protein
MVDETHEHAHHVLKNKLGEVEHVTNLKNLVSAQKSKFSTPLFMETKTFMQATKKRDAFFIYALPTTNVKPQQHEIPSQYKGYKDVFEEKNANTLLQHWPYDYMIDLKEGAQPPFGPIYNLSQDELAIFREYYDEKGKPILGWYH